MSHFSPDCGYSIHFLISNLSIL